MAFLFITRVSVLRKKISLYKCLYCVEYQNATFLSLVFCHPYVFLILLCVFHNRLICCPKERIQRWNDKLIIPRALKTNFFKTLRLINWEMSYRRSNDCKCRYVQIGVFERETLSFINCGTEYLKNNVSNIDILCIINSIKHSFIL
jgi:hypothetical protein